MDVLAWLLDPIYYQEQISNAYHAWLYSLLDQLSAELTRQGYPPVP